MWGASITIFFKYHKMWCKRPGDGDRLAREKPHQIWCGFLFAPAELYRSDVLWQWGGWCGRPAVQLSLWVLLSQLQSCCWPEPDQGLVRQHVCRLSARCFACCQAVAQLIARNDCGSFAWADALPLPAEEWPVFDRSPLSHKVPHHWEAGQLIVKTINCEIIINSFVGWFKALPELLAAAVCKPIFTSWSEGYMMVSCEPLHLCVALSFLLRSECT